MKNRKLLQFSFLAILVVELLSLNVFLRESLMPFVFFAILLTTFILSFKNLKYGLYIIFVELAIGSLGYLFWFNLAEQKISIRIGLWLSVMLVWFVKLVINHRRNHLKEILRSIKNSSYSFWLLLLFFFVFWGLLNGILSNNGLKNIFLDSNAWMFFSLFFPCLYVVQQSDLKKTREELLVVLFSAIIFISLKTLAVLYVFSHDFGFLSEMYQWIRDTRVGEITKMESGFVRVFFQSHIYLLTAFFVFLLKTVSVEKLKDIYKKRENLFSFFLTSFFLCVIILGYSRSNWVGLVIGLFILFAIFFLFKLRVEGLKSAFIKVFQIVSVLIISFLFSMFLIVFTINFPLPKNSTNIGAVSIVSDRASNISTEAGASSRWKLLPVLRQEITKHPILGKGFGTTVTYISDDPRVREKDPEGVYTSYAFEWGWLDIWLKLGFVGLLVYLFFLFKTTKTYLLDRLWALYQKKEQANFGIKFSFILGLVIIAGVSVFSPYLNHPLGIGYLLLIFLLFENKEKL